MFLVLGASTVTLPVAIGVVCLIAGAMYMFRDRILLGGVLLVIGFLLGGLSIFGVLG